MTSKFQFFFFATCSTLAITVVLLESRSFQAAQSSAPRRPPVFPCFESKDDESVSKTTTATSKSLSGPSVTFITYGDSKFAGSKKRIVQEAVATGWFQLAASFGPTDLPASFAKRYAEILSMPRGGGYWIWKYAILEQTLARIDEGDFVVYLDAGCSINPRGKARFDEYLRMVSGSPYDVMSLENHFPERQYTTEQIFRYFNVSKDDEIRSKHQYVGGVLVLRKGAHLRRWLRMVWDALEADEWMFTDKYNAEAKRADPEFRENRHDQSVSSVSRKLVGSVVIPDEANAPYKIEHPFWAKRQRV